MRIYSVSYMATANDNGHCLSFDSRADAESARKWLLDDGCHFVSAVWC